MGPLEVANAADAPEPHRGDAPQPVVEDGADAMVKAARVQLVGYEKVGGGYTSVVVRGDVAAVKAATEARIAEAIAAGATHYLTKPVNVPEFLSAVDSVLEDLDTHFG